MRELIKRLALAVPPIRRLWSSREQLQAEVSSLREQLATGQGGVPREEAAFYTYRAVFDAEATIRRYEASGTQPAPEFCTNFLGVRIPPAVLPGILNERVGTVEPPPLPRNWHADIAEWAGALRAVDTAQRNFRMLELGCGWGCWMANTGVAARNAGLEVEVLGIEGDAAHLAWAEETMAANGFEAAQYRLIHGVAAPKTGRALFPRLENPGGDWGAEPILEPTQTQLDSARESGSHDVLDAYRLVDVVGDEPIDLLHIDIQGGEYDFVRDNFADIARTTRRVLIGTHSRVIDGQLMAVFREQGWALEVERPSLFTIQDGAPVNGIDGVQLWRNPAF